MHYVLCAFLRVHIYSDYLKQILIGHVVNPLSKDIETDLRLHTHTKHLGMLIYTYRYILKYSLLCAYTYRSHDRPESQDEYHETTEAVPGY